MLEYNEMEPNRNSLFPYGIKQQFPRAEEPSKQRRPSVRIVG